MTHNLRPEELSREQMEVVEKAAVLIIKARKEAAAMLVQAGIVGDGLGLGSHCEAHIPAFGACPCSEYKGDGGPCENTIFLDVGAASRCDHPAHKHASL